MFKNNATISLVQYEMSLKQKPILKWNEPENNINEYQEEYQVIGIKDKYERPRQVKYLFMI